MRLPAVRNLWRKWSEFLTKLAEYQDARRRERGPVWSQIGPSLVIAVLIWSGTYYLVSFPQGALQLEADTVAFRKLGLESQELSALTKVANKIVDREEKRSTHLGDILARERLNNRGAYDALNSELMTNEAGAAGDLGRITPFENIGFDWAQDWARSLAELLKAELGVWYAEEDLLDEKSKGGSLTTARRARSAERRVERQVVTYDAKLQQMLSANEEVASFSRATQENTTTQAQALELRVEWMRLLYDLSSTVIVLALLLWAFSLVLRGLVFIERSKKASATPDSR